MFRLLRYYSVMSAIAMMAAVAILVGLYRQSAVSDLVEAAEHQNVVLSHAFSNTLWSRFRDYVMSTSEDDGETLRARPETGEIRGALLSLAAGMPVLKLKIYTLDGLAVFSSDPSQIGSRAENAAFRTAVRRGAPVSKLSRRDRFNALFGEVRDRNVVASYLPIRGAGAAVEGVFELYSDVTPLVDKVERTSINLGLGLLVVLGAAYTVLVLIVRRADRVVAERQADLLDSERIAHEKNLALEWEVNERRQAEVALQESEARLRAVFDNTPVCLNLKDPEGRFLLVNKPSEEWLDRPANELIGRTASEVLEDVAKVENLAVVEKAVVETGEVCEMELRVPRPDGKIYNRVLIKFPVKSADGSISAVGAVGIDITERKRVEQDLRKLSQAVEQSPASVVITTADGNIEYVNPRFVEMTGYSEEEVIGRNPRLLKSGHMPPEVYEELWATITAGNEWRGELYNKKKNGDLFWEYSAISPIKAPDGTVTHFVAVNEDVTLRKEYEERLLHQANFDGLTGLPNRVLALDRLTQALARAKRETWGVGLIFVDLDNFKNINDTLGHAAGDELLVEAARRLAASVRGSDTVSRVFDYKQSGPTVARIGGDEFLIILSGLQAAEHGEVVARKILDACSRPFVLDGHDFFVTASVGLTIYPMDGDDPQTLMRNADAAMYRAKEIGRNTYQFFTPEMNAQAAERLKIESHLRYALERNELSLVYQPIVDVASGDLVGAEALLRWHSPRLGPVTPDRFIPVAEATGLIVPIGEWVLKTACEEAASWRRRVSVPLRVSVNASSRQFRGSDLVTTVATALEESGLPADCLELEITESLLIDEESEATTTLEELSAMGVRLSIDDFGTGYSSLSYIKRFPINTLKIDRAFVRDANTDPEDAALARAIIAMGRSLGLKVVGEGAETLEQLRFLRAERCDLVQGFYFSEPLTPENFTRLLDDQDRPVARIA